MSNVWERMIATIKEDMEKLKSKEATSVKDAVRLHANDQEKKAVKLEKQLQEQKQLLRQFAQEKDEIDVRAASRRRQVHLAREEGEDALAAYAEKDLAAYEQQSSRLERMITSAREQQLELEQMFQEVQHQLKERKLDQMEMQGKEKAAHLRREMRSMQENEVEDAAEQKKKEEEANINDLERQLMLLEKRHGEKESPSDLLNK